MLDLNTLIPRGSGLQLTNAFNINDSGEILAKSAPLGFTPNDDADLGHLVLLVPCGQDDEESCEGRAEATTSSAPVVSRAELKPSPQRSVTASDIVAASRAQMLRQYHLVGVGTPKN
jgi:hypothetical protein